MTVANPAHYATKKHREAPSEFTALVTRQMRPDVGFEFRSMGSDYRVVSVDDGLEISRVACRRIDNQSVDYDTAREEVYDQLARITPTVGERILWDDALNFVARHDLRGPLVLLASLASALVLVIVALIWLVLFGDG